VAFGELTPSSAYQHALRIYPAVRGPLRMANEGDGHATRIQRFCKAGVFGLLKPLTIDDRPVVLVALGISEMSNDISDINQNL
jgi:hypothetical protein